MSNDGGEQAVLADVSNGIMTITLNRPDRGNAWNGAVKMAYFDILERAAKSPDVRAIIVTGAGKAFCVGGDGQDVQDTAALGSVPGIASNPYWFPLSVGKPIIAAINGACFGIGMQQALTCDIRFASKDAKFSTAYAKRGLVAEMGMSWLLPRLVGTGHAMDLLLSARLVRAIEAKRIGLVNRVVAPSDLLSETTAYARQLVETCSPRSMWAMKQQVSLDLMSSLSEGYRRAEEMLANAIKQDDFREGVASWQESRAPQFPALAEELAFIDLELAGLSDSIAGVV
jgi:enoyl-CoA hydratase/carnithine racemase